MELIAVVMAAPDPKTRFQDAISLLNYGYSVSQMYTDENKDPLPEQKIEGGIEDVLYLSYAGPFEYLDTSGSNLSEIQKEISLPDVVQAPVTEGDAIGEAVYKLNGTRIGSVSILAAKSVDRATYRDYWKKVWILYLMKR